MGLSVPSPTRATTRGEGRGTGAGRPNEAAGVGFEDRMSYEQAFAKTERRAVQRGGKEKAHLLCVRVGTVRSRDSLEHGHA